MSWERFSETSPVGGDLAYDAPRSSTASVELVTAPDDRTIVIRLRKPDASVLPLLSTNNHFWVLPREAANGGFNPKVTMRGNGPYRLDDYEPSIGVFYRKNPDYYVEGRPFLDAIEQRTLSQSATIEAQFRAGNFHLPGPVTTMAAENILAHQAGQPIDSSRRGPGPAAGAQGYVSF